MAHCLRWHGTEEGGPDQRGGGVACGIPEHGPQRGLKCAFMGLISAHISQSFSFATGRNICVPMYSTVWPWSVAIFKHFEIPSRQQIVGLIGILKTTLKTESEVGLGSWSICSLRIYNINNSSIICNNLMPLHSLPGYLPARHDTPQYLHPLLYLFIYLQRRSLRFMTVC